MEVRLGNGGRAVEIDERGQRLNATAILHRGRLVVGQCIAQERARDVAAGRKLRKLSTEEMRCLSAAREAETRA